jgi:phage head maturation protease
VTEVIEARAEWDAAYINDLPDSAFALILPGGEKDEDGKTTPRDLRKLPHHNAAGDLDMPHLRNALSREPQSDMSDSEHDRARTHLQAHMEAEGRSEGGAEFDFGTLRLDSDIEIRDLTKREIDIRLMQWGATAETLQGPETFNRTAFDGTNPEDVILTAPEHEIRFGLGQDGRPVLRRVPVGVGTRYEARDDGPHMRFRVAKTPAGDDTLALIEARVLRHASVEISEVPGGTVYERSGSRRLRIHNRVALKGVTTTYQPAYSGADVLAARSQEGDGPVSETVTAPDTGAQPDTAAVVAGVVDQLLPQIQARSVDPTEALDKIIDRLEKVEEQARMAIDIPATPQDGPPDDFHTGDWMNLVLRVMSGDRVPQKEIEARVAADLVTSDNLGVIPPMFTGDVRETIDTSRPFLESTRRLNLPRAGMQLTVPVITTRPTVGVQENEKDELASTATAIDPANFNPTSIGGYGDISLQLLKRSDPSYLELYLDLLGEAYGIMADDKAVDALLAAVGVNPGGELDPENLTLGTAWANAAVVSRRLIPDRLWLSTAAVAAFIDAKRADGTTPMYSQLDGNFSAGGGAGGTVSGLRPVHVPALDDEAVDIVVGPSRGFGWTEDGTYTLQVDVPAKAGRDVGLIGMVWYAPLYPAAFTTFTLPA